MYKVQQFEWGFRTYDVDTESPVDGFIAEYDITDEQAEIIKMAGSTIEVIDNQIKVTEPQQDPLQPIVDAEAERRELEVQRQVEEYQAWLQTPEGKIANRYLYFMQHGEYPVEELN